MPLSSIHRKAIANSTQVTSPFLERKRETQVLPFFTQFYGTLCSHQFFLPLLKRRECIRSSLANILLRHLRTVYPYRSRNSCCQPWLRQFLVAHGKITLIPHLTDARARVVQSNAHGRIHEDVSVVFSIESRGYLWQSNQPAWHEVWENRIWLCVATFALDLSSLLPTMGWNSWKKRISSRNNFETRNWMVCKFFQPPCIDVE